eukprot:jgi/Chrzof1/6996/Cz02g07020.t1
MIDTATAPNYDAEAAARARTKANGAQQAANGTNSQGTYQGPNTAGLDKLGYQQEAEVIQKETVKQDQYLDQISKGLDQIKYGAMNMNEELRRQEYNVDRLRKDADVLEGRLHNVNTQGFRNV